VVYGKYLKKKGNDRQQVDTECGYTSVPGLEGHFNGEILLSSQIQTENFIKVRKG
jgi:hypothetical protein